MTATRSTARGGALVGALVVLAALVAAPSTADPRAWSIAVSAPRIAGADRVATAEALAETWRDGSASGPVAVVVVPRDRTDVALASAGLAGRLGTTTLLSDVPPRASTVAAVRQLGASSVLAVGPPPLAAGWAAAGFDVVEVRGADDGGPALAAALARAGAAEDGRVDPEGGRADHVVVAGTGGLPDALAVGPVAHRAGLPILLTAAAALDPHAAAAIEDLGVRRATVVGGEAVVGPAVVDALRSRGVTVERVAGDGREATAIAVAGLGPEPAAVLLAAGDDPADAAGAAALAARRDAVVLPPGPTTAAWLAARCGRGWPLTSLGGDVAVPPDQDAAHRQALQRCGPADEAMVVPIGVATPGAPGAEQAVADLVAGSGGWGSRRLRFELAAADHHLGVVVAPPGGCGGPDACRRGRDLVVDGATWAAADAAGRASLIDLLVGSWLGEPVAPAGRPTDVDRARAADRFVPRAVLVFGGDVHAERHIATAVAEGRNPLAPIADRLAAADLAVLNLETPLSTRGTPASKTYVFRGPPAFAADLAEAGVDVVSLANNHALDHGVDALADTLAHLGAAGVGAVGAGPDAAAATRASLHDTPAGRVAVVGLTRVLHTRAWEAGPGRWGLATAYDEPAAAATVRAAADQADVVVVAIHWGVERADCPDPTQRHLARLLVDAGADLVIGHHPHVLQGVQRLGTADGGAALVAYSLGNLVWYHTAAPSRFTGLLEVELPLLEDPAWHLAPAEIGADGSPHPVGDPLAGSITARVLDRSPGGSLGCAFPG